MHLPNLNCKIVIQDLNNLYHFIKLLSNVSNLSNLNHVSNFGHIINLSHIDNFSHIRAFHVKCSYILP